MVTEADQTLQDVCDEVHRRMTTGEAWGRELIDFIVSQPAVVDEAKRQAKKRQWIDTTISIEDLTRDLLAEAWQRLRHFKMNEAHACQWEFIAFLKQCLWHLPQSQERRKAKKREAAGIKSVEFAANEVLESEPDLGSSHYSIELELELRLLWFAACRTLKPPLNEIMRLISDQRVSQKEVAEMYGLAESTISTYIQESKPLLIELISNWRLGFGEVIDEG